MKRLLTGLIAAVVLLTGLAAPAAAAVRVGDCQIHSSTYAECTGPDIAGLVNHKGVTGLRLEAVPASLKVLASLPNLDSLQLGEQFATAEIPSRPLSDLAGTSIAHLELHQPAQDLAPLAAMPNLTFLDAYSTEYAKGAAALAKSTTLEILNIAVNPGADPRPLLASTNLQSIRIGYRGKNITVKLGQTFTVPTFTGLDGKPFEFVQTEYAPSSKRTGFNTFKAIAADYLHFLEGRERMAVTPAGRNVEWGVQLLSGNTLLVTDTIKPVKGSIRPGTKSVKVGDYASLAMTGFNYPHSRYTCAWLRNGKATGVKDCHNYPLGVADSKATLTLRVTVHPGSGYVPYILSSTTTYTAKYTVLDVFKHRAKVTGTTRVGSTLKATTTNVPKGTALAHQWLRDGKTIKGATRASYTLVAADLGKRLSVKVTAKKGGFVSSATTTGKTAKVSKGVLKLKKYPTVSGTKKVGKTLTAKPGTWSAKPDSYRYQWYRSGAAINKATKAKYKFTARDKGKVIYVKVTAHKKGYTSKSANSKVK